MASKVSPLYAKTRILLNLWALEQLPSAKSNFVPSGKAYKSALNELVENGALTKEKASRSDVYDLSNDGQSTLRENLLDETFRFSSNIGPKTTNAILAWFRQGFDGSAVSNSVAKRSDNGSATSNGSAAQIGSYSEFSEVALNTYDRLNQDYNLDDLVPIYRIRREIGDRLSRQNFNEWLLQVQADDQIQLMGGDIPNVTPDQLEDSVAIPGAGTRFYAKRL